MIISLGIFSLRIITIGHWFENLYIFYGNLQKSTKWGQVPQTRPTACVCARHRHSRSCTYYVHVDKGKMVLNSLAYGLLQISENRYLQIFWWFSIRIKSFLLEAIQSRPLYVCVLRMSHEHVVKWIGEKQHFIVQENYMEIRFQFLKVQFYWHTTIPTHYVLVLAAQMSQWSS